MATTAEVQQVTEEPVLHEKGSTPLKVPIGAPTADSHPKLRAPLTADQQAKYDWLLEQVKAWEEVPSHKGKGGPLTDNERMWLTQECLLRYLRATKWHQKESAKRLMETLTWRREYGVEDLTPEHISPENATGKQIILGYDKEGRVCQYLNPGRQNTDVSPRQVQHLVFMVERVIELMPPQQETLALLINFKQSKNRSNTAPGLGQGKEVLNILQTHYPERLGKALIINVPWIVWGFFKLITPFIDPLTREKLKFNEDMTQYVPKEQLWTEYAGGLLDFEYDHSVYWPALMKLCEERREARRERWIAGGKLIGEHEDYLKGTSSHGAAPPIKAEVVEVVSTVNEVPDAVVEVNGEAPEAAVEVETKEVKVESDAGVNGMAGQDPDAKVESETKAKAEADGEIKVGDEASRE